METLAVDDVVKLASVSTKFRNLLAGTSKTASEGPTDFDETVPVNENGEGEKGEKKPPEEKPKEEPPAAVPIEQPPVPAPADAGAMTPEQAGANAARAFIGEDTMAAASTGDPNAQDVVARVAGQVAAGVAEAAARKMGNGAGAPPPGGMPPEGMPPEGMPPEGAPPVPPAEGAPAGLNAIPAAPQSPEEAVANDIVPQPSAAAPPPPPPNGVPVEGKGPATQVAPVANAGPVPAGGGGPVDMATVQKLIQLAKSGQL